MDQFFRKYDLSHLSDSAASRLAEYEGRFAAGARGTPGDLRAILEHYSGDERRILAFHAVLLFLQFHSLTRSDDVKAVVNEDEHNIIDDAFATSHEPFPEIPGFRLHGRLRDQGDQSIIYRATEELTGRDVVIKVPFDRPFTRAGDRYRFLAETKALASLNHPNIVPILHAGRIGTRHYLVMPLIEGIHLDIYCAISRPDVRQRLVLFTKIANAVNAAHQRGILHRDLKPANILVDQKLEPHVLDFGLARSLTTTPATEPGTFVGSLPWSAPEQVERCPEKIDTRTDVYALGVMLCLAVRGTYPYPITGDRKSIEHNILVMEPTFYDEPPDIKAILSKALAKEPERRYQSAGELGQDIQRFLDDQPIEAKRHSSWYVARKAIARHRRLAGMAVFSLALVIAWAVTATAWLVASRRAIATQDTLDYVDVIAHAFLQRAADAENPKLVIADDLVELANHLSRSGKDDLAESLLRSAVTICRSRQLTHESWNPSLNSANDVLATVLANRKKFAEAEPLMLAFYKSVADDADNLLPGHYPGAAIEPLERIVKLYESWLAAEPDEDRARELTAWRKRLAKFQAMNPHSPSPGVKPDDP